MTNTVDVLIPFHRDDEFLNQCIKSVKDSCNVKTRVLLCDDREDKTKKLSPYLSSYKIVTNLKSSGFPSAIKSLHPFIKSDYVTIVGSDDLVHANKFFSQILALNSAEADLCVTEMEKINTNNQRIPSLAPEVQTDIVFPKLLLFGPYGADGTWLATRDWWIRNIVFPNGIFHDWDLAIRISNKTKIVKINEHLYSYRMHDSQTTRSQSFLTFTGTNEFSKSWNKLSSTYSLPRLNLKEILMISQPWLADKKGVNNYKIQEWHDAWISGLTPVERKALAKAIFFKNLFRFLRFGVWIKYKVGTRELIANLFYLLSIPFKIIHHPRKYLISFLFVRAKVR